MTEINIEDDVTVKLISFNGGDHDVIQAAQVSVYGENEPTLPEGKPAGLINYLLREKHGSPFEHNFLKFYIKAPIFVFREFHRHRVGWSYNEISGRYTELEPNFYIPGPTRPLVQKGPSSKPQLVFDEHGSLHVQMSDIQADAFEYAWKAYQKQLSIGVAKETARGVLPLGIMSEMYASCNARSLMSFLSLRTQDEKATYPSRPQYEIELVARKMEESFATLFPMTYDSYNKNGRVAP